MWNRSDISDKISQNKILRDLNNCKQNDPDVIVEVAHPDISSQYGHIFLQCADYLMGSPTGLADRNTEASLSTAAKKHGVYIPSGAFWGGLDIRKMADRGTLKGLTVTMKKHPSSFKLNGQLADKNKAKKKK